MKLHQSEARPSRRELVQSAAAALGLLTPVGLESPAHASTQSSNEATLPDSHIGSLYPFVENQAVKGEARLSYLNPRFHDLNAWKRRARGRLLDLLHYAPVKCDPQPRILESVDC